MKHQAKFSVSYRSKRSDNDDNDDVCVCERFAKANIYQLETSAQSVSSIYRGQTPAKKK